jgi:hypothetical protein
MIAAKTRVQPRFGGANVCVKSRYRLWFELRRDRNINAKKYNRQEEECSLQTISIVARSLCDSLWFSASHTGLAAWIKQLVQPVLRKPAQFAGDLAHRAAGLVGLLRDRGGLFISDLRRKHGDHRERLLN